MRKFEFHLGISYQQYLDYYRGAIKQVLVQCTSGEKIQIPAALLTPYVSPSGIHGHFVLTCDDDGKGSRLQRRTDNTT
jgi:hypothetical protein